MQSNTLRVIGGILLIALLIGGAIVLGRTESSGTALHEPRLEHVHGLAVDITNPDRLLIATHHGLLQLDVAANALSQVGTAKDDLMGFTAHPTAPSIYFSSGHPSRGGNLGFQKSTDGGITWQKISDGINGPVDFHSMAISRVNPDIVYGHFRGLQRSTDGGRTWEMAKGIIQPFSLSTDPMRESVLYAATQNGVMVSEDTGDTWKGLSPQLEGGAVSAFVISPDAKSTLAFSETLDGMAKSVDGGLTWQKLGEVFGGHTVLHIAFSKTDTATAFALTDSNSIYRSSDGGSTWVKIR